MQLMAVEGVMARRVGDVRLGLAIVAGAHPRDPESVPGAARRAAAARPAAWRCWPSRPAATRTRRSPPRCAARATRWPTRAMTSSRPSRRTTRPALDVWGRFLFSDIRAQEPILRAVMGPDAIRFLDFVGDALPRAGRGRAGRTLVERRMIAPRLEPVPARAPADPQPDLDPAAVPARLGRRERGAGARHDAADAPGHAREPARAPAAAVPAGKAAGLPAGVQVMGARFQELACLEAAEAIEGALGRGQAIDPILERRTLTLRCRVRKRTAKE